MGTSCGPARPSAFVHSNHLDVNLSTSHSVVDVDIGRKRHEYARIFPVRFIHHHRVAHWTNKNTSAQSSTKGFQFVCTEIDRWSGCCLLWFYVLSSIRSISFWRWTHSALALWRVRTPTSFSLRAVHRCERAIITRCYVLYGFLNDMEYIDFMESDSSWDVEWDDDMGNWSALRIAPLTIDKQILVDFIICHWASFFNGRFNVNVACEWGLLSQRDRIDFYDVHLAVNRFANCYIKLRYRHARWQDNLMKCLFAKRHTEPATKAKHRRISIDLRFSLQSAHIVFLLLATSIACAATIACGRNR